MAGGGVADFFFANFGQLREMIIAHRLNILNILMLQQEIYGHIWKYEDYIRLLYYTMVIDYSMVCLVLIASHSPPIRITTHDGGVALIRGPYPIGIYTEAGEKGSSIMKEIACQPNYIYFNSIRHIMYIYI